SRIETLWPRNTAIQALESAGTLKRVSLLEFALGHPLEFSLPFAGNAVQPSNVLGLLLEGACQRLNGDLHLTLCLYFAYGHGHTQNAIRAYFRFHNHPPHTSSFCLSSCYLIHRLAGIAGRHSNELGRQHARLLTPCTPGLS